MCNGNNELDMSHAFATHLFLGDFNAASVADNAFIADTFVLSAVAFIVFDRAENALAEQAVALWLVGAVVDGFRFQHLTA